jgi:hypothetical protein
MRKLLVDELLEVDLDAEKSTFTSLTLRASLALALRLSPLRKVRRAESLTLISAESTPFSSLFSASPSKNHSGWYRSFSKEI